MTVSIARRLALLFRVQANKALAHAEDPRERLERPAKVLKGLTTPAQLTTVASFLGVVAGLLARFARSPVICRSKQTWQARPDLRASAMTTDRCQPTAAPMPTLTCSQGVPHDRR
jgi:hypothetical protein